MEPKIEIEWSNTVPTFDILNQRDLQFVEGWAWEQLRSIGPEREEGRKQARELCDSAPIFCGQVKVDERKNERGDQEDHERIWDENRGGRFIWKWGWKFAWLMSDSRENEFGNNGKIKSADNRVLEAFRI